MDVTKAETIVQVKSKGSYNVSANELESTLCRGQAFVFVKINDKYWAAKVQRKLECSANVHTKSFVSTQLRSPQGRFRVWLGLRFFSWC